MSKKQHSPLRLFSLTETNTIKCMVCEQDKPEHNAREFHAWKVCAECVVVIDTAVTKKNKNK